MMLIPACWGFEPSAILRSFASPQPLPEMVEASLPEATISLEPLGGVPQTRAVEPRGPELGLSTPRDQSRPLEHLEVLGDRLDADREGPSQLGYGGLALGQPREYLPTRGVGEGGEGFAELVGCRVIQACL